MTINKIKFLITKFKMSKRVNIILTKKIQISLKQNFKKQLIKMKYLKKFYKYYNIKEIKNK